MKLEELHGFTCYNFKKVVARSPLSTANNCLILESNARPDYYAKKNFPPNKRDDEMHLYIPIRKSMNCFQDIIFRETCCFNKKYNTDVHITPGQMTYENKSRQVVRIRASEKEQIPNIIKDLKTLEIDFLKDTKVSEYESVIFFKKYTEFKELEDGVYQDVSRPFRYFFTINKKVDLETFIKGVKTIKNNCDFHMFDTFLAFTFVKDRVQDFIGISSEHCDINRFSELESNIKKVFNNLK